jgi:hypothetical protein
MSLIHETFHALGLKHPGNYNGSGSGEGPFLSLTGYSLSSLNPTVSGANLNIGLGANGSLTVENYYGSAGSMRFLISGNYYQYDAATGWQITSAPTIIQEIASSAPIGLTTNPAAPYNSPQPLKPVDYSCSLYSGAGKLMHEIGTSSLRDAIGMS